MSSWSRTPLCVCTTLYQERGKPRPASCREEQVLGRGPADTCFDEAAVPGSGVDGDVDFVPKRALATPPETPGSSKSSSTPSPRQTPRRRATCEGRSTHRRRAHRAARDAGRLKAGERTAR